MTDREDNIRLYDDERQDRAREALAAIKARHAGKEFVRVPLEDGSGYREIEKTKYERLNRKTKNVKP